MGTSVRSRLMGKEHQGFKWGSEEISNRGDSEGRETFRPPSAFLA